MPKKQKHTPPFSLSKAFAFSSRTLQEGLYRQPMLHLNCNGALVIENYKQIITYQPLQIKLDMGKICLLIEGDALVMDTLQKTCITVHGNVFTVRLCYDNDT
ncbi:MAG: YabP/YqfC family sporulation protein [Ruthenibacterium sp.]